MTHHAAYRSTNTTCTFYGLGHETENTADDRELYQARLTQARPAPSLLLQLKQGATLLELRPELRSVSPYLAVGKAGSFGFLDNGRIWTEADDALDTSKTPSTLWLSNNR